MVYIAMGSMAVFLLALWLLSHKDSDSPDEAHKTTSIEAHTPEGVDGSHEFQDRRLPSSDRRRMVTSKAFLIKEGRDVIPGDALQVVESLKDDAESGNGLAAFDIYQKVKACRSAMEDRLDPRLIAVYEKMGAADSLLTGVEESLRDCESIASHKDLMGGDWLEMAAESGFVEAQLLYAIDVEAVVGTSVDMLRDPEAVAQYKRRRISFLETAASAGSIDALLYLSDTYGGRGLKGTSPVKAYAYYAAAERAYPASVSPLVMAARKKNLSRDELLRADELARSIYKGCCQ